MVCRNTIRRVEFIACVMLSFCLQNEAWRQKNNGAKDFGIVDLIWQNYFGANVSCSESLVTPLI